jgi:hypothetical protein
LGEYQNLWRKERADKMWRSEVEEERRREEVERVRGGKKRRHGTYMKEEGRKESFFHFSLFHSATSWTFTSNGTLHPRPIKSDHLPSTIHGVRLSQIHFPSGAAGVSLCHQP